jgi:hypothetical protein
MSTARRQFVAPISFGLGDLVVSLPVVQAAVSTGALSGTETWLVTRSHSQVALAERISGLSGTVPEHDVAIWPPEALVDLRDHPLQRDYWWGSPEFTAVYGTLSIASGPILGWSATSPHQHPSSPGTDLTPKVWSCSSPTPMARRGDGPPSGGSSLPLRSGAEVLASP